MLRRLAAASYDLLVICALWMLVYFPLIASGLIAGTRDDNFDPAQVLLRGAIAFAYFGRSWTRGGRTLGALAWGLAVEREDGAPLAWRDAAQRFGVALVYLAPLAALELLAPASPSAVAYFAVLLGPFLFGTLWCRFDRHGRALHELPLVTRVTFRRTANG